MVALGLTAGLVVAGTTVAGASGDDPHCPVMRPWACSTLNFDDGVPLDTSQIEIAPPSHLGLDCGPWWDFWSYDCHLVVVAGS
jgi:hypothetical protein